MNPKFFRNGIVMLVLVVGTAALLFTWIQGSTPTNQVGYSQFLTDVQNSKVKEVVQQGETLTVTVNSVPSTYTVVVPSVLTQVYPDMLAAAKVGGVQLDSAVFKADPTPDTSWLGLVLTGLLPLLIIGGFIFFMMRQAQGTNNQAMSFGKSRARMFLGNKTVVTFGDVAGVDEAKTELQEVVEFLKYPEKFNSLGARIPRGVLLVGPPGNRQDPDGPRRRRRGRCAVLQHLRFGIRRDVRRRRRQPRSRPVRPGQAELAMHRLRGRDRRGRTPARRRARRQP